MSKFFIKAHALRTSASDPLQKYRFRLMIPGMTGQVGFQKVSGLSQETEVTEYAEGTNDYTHKLPGRPKTGEVTAERGVYSNGSLYALLKETIENPTLRKTIVFQVLDRQGNVAKTHKLAEARISKWEDSEYDATSNDVAIEKITIQFEHFL